MFGGTYYGEAILAEFTSFVPYTDSPAGAVIKPVSKWANTDIKPPAGWKLTPKLANAWSVKLTGSVPYLFDSANILYDSNNYAYDNTASTNTLTGRVPTAWSQI
jgi:hypothetical protein